MSQEIFELLRSDNTIHANRTLAASIGLNEAVIYSALLGKEYYYRSREQTDDEDMFYATASDLEERTTLTQRQQDRAIKHLEEFNLISTKLKGMPAKKHFKINQDTKIILTLLREKPKRKLNKNKEISDNESSQNNGETSINKMLKQDSAERSNLFQQNVETSIDKTAKQDPPNSETIINLNNNRGINNKYNNAHARDGKNSFDEIIDDFTKNENVRTALRGYIKMRLSRPKTVTTGYTFSVILKRLSELSHDPEIQTKILEQSIIHSYPDLYELKKAGERNDPNGKSANNRGIDKTCFTGLADGKDNKSPDFSGIVKLG